MSHFCHTSFQFHGRIWTNLPWLLVSLCYKPYNQTHSIFVGFTYWLYLILVDEFQLCLIANCTASAQIIPDVHRCSNIGGIFPVGSSWRGPQEFRVPEWSPQWQFESVESDNDDMPLQTLHCSCRGHLIVVQTKRSSAESGFLECFSPRPVGQDLQSIQSEVQMDTIIFIWTSICIWWWFKVQFFPPCLDDNIHCPTWPNLWGPLVLYFFIHPHLSHFLVHFGQRFGQTSPSARIH